MHGQRWPVVGSLVLSVLVLLAAAPRHAPFTLGILRRDGILLPFATYDGSWKNHWPAPGQQVNMPFAAADIPRGWWHDKQPILGWTLLALGPKPVTVHTVQVKGINWYRAACEQSVGLFTDYKPAILPPPLRVHPYPKDALAYSGDVKIDPIAIVPPTDKVVTLLQTLLPDAITTPENAAIKGIHGWRHSYSTAERERMPVSLEALYRVPGGRDGRDLYYFEAVKRYFMPKDDRFWRMKPLVGQPREPTFEQHCDLVTFASGWFTTKPTDGTIGDLIPNIAISSCDYAQARFMLPLGTVEIDGSRHWIVQWSNPMFETYAILKPTKVGMEQLLEAGGGACPTNRND